LQTSDYVHVYKHTASFMVTYSCHSDRLYCVYGQGQVINVAFISTLVAVLEMFLSVTSKVIL